MLLVIADPWRLLAGLVCGYGFAWAGPFIFEKNRPATFKSLQFSAIFRYL